MQQQFDHIPLLVSMRTLSTWAADRGCDDEAFTTLEENGEVLLQSASTKDDARAAFDQAVTDLDPAQRGLPDHITAAGRMWTAAMNKSLDLGAPMFAEQHEVDQYGSGFTFAQSLAEQGSDEDQAMDDLAF